MKIAAFVICLAALSGLPSAVEALPSAAGPLSPVMDQGGLVHRAKSSPMSDRELYRLLRDEGYTDISSIRRRATTYTVQARDWRGRLVQVTVDGRSQRIIDVTRLRESSYDNYRERDDSYRWNDSPGYGYERPFQRPRPERWGRDDGDYRYDGRDRGGNTYRGGGGIQMDERGNAYDPNNPCFPAICKNR